jgi:hypothetical protein
MMFTFREIFYNQKNPWLFCNGNPRPRARKNVLGDLKPWPGAPNWCGAASLLAINSIVSAVGWPHRRLGLPFYRPRIHISAPNLGKSWRDQKLVANQDNKKYIAATVGAAWHLVGDAV